MVSDPTIRWYSGAAVKGRFLFQIDVYAVIKNRSIAGLIFLIQREWQCGIIVTCPASRNAVISALSRKHPNTFSRAG